MKKNIIYKVLPLVLVALTAGSQAFAAKKTDLVAVSADIVEISGSLTTNTGFAWNQLLDFSESEIPGIFSIGEFERKSLLSTRLHLLESEGKAQVLSNPKVIAKSNTSSNFTAGGEIPFPVVNNTSAGVDFKTYGVRLDVMPTILPERGNIIHVQFEIELSNPDYASPIVINGSSVPSIITRKLNSQVELNSGETLVIGGLKSSSRSVAEGRVPVLGKIPLLGALFKTKTIKEDQRSLFLFITVEMVE